MNNPAAALRGRVIEQFGTVERFASAINWSARKASYITTGRQPMKISEAEECAEILQLNREDFMRIFYPKLSIKWTKKN